MDIFKLIVKNIALPLLDKREGRIITPHLKALEKSQYFSPEQIADIQFERLRQILNYAGDHSRFYRQRFKGCGFQPGDLKSLDDLMKLPVLTKDDIRQNQQDIISDEYTPANMLYKRTGGSTSVPLKLYIDWPAANMKTAATVRHNRWAGYDRGDRLAAIWGDTDKEYSFKERLYNVLNGGVIYLDTLKMTEQYILQFVERMRRSKPSILMGHAHSLYTFAVFIEKHGITDLAIEGIISTAEILYDHERFKIESVFGKILFDRYGCEELSIIASECLAHDGLHVNAEGLYVEILGGDNVNPGKLIITDLWNKGMPFIRYEIGDMALFKEGRCTCGRGLPRLARVYGRTADLLYTPDGRTISGISVLDTFTIHVPGIRQVQIVQNKLDLLNFKVVKGDDFGEESLATLKQKIPQFFGSRMRYEIEYVDKIEQTARGKYRFSICNIAPPERYLSSPKI